MIVTATRETLDMIPACFRDKSVVCPAIGIETDEFETVLSDLPPASDATPSSRLELLFVGRLLPWKGVHLLLRALSKMKDPRRQVQLTVIGSGPDRARLDRLATELGVIDQVSWIPWMPREELLRTYHKFDIFVFPSLHDSGGTAVLEAMSFGLPVLCLDLGGPSMLVTNECGRVIQTQGATEEQVIASIAAYFAEALANPELMTANSIAARRRAQSLTWKANVERLYGAEILEKRHLALANSSPQIHNESGLYTS